MQITVEWGIGKVYQICGILSKKRCLEVGRDQLMQRLYVAVLLCNMHTALYSCNTSTYFNFRAPDLEEYLHAMF
jgi:hypothetical protein